MAHLTEAKKALAFAGREANERDAAGARTPDYGKVQALAALAAAHALIEIAESPSDGSASGDPVES